jgi:hypothetical protein
MHEEYSNGWEHYKRVGDVETVRVSDRHCEAFSARIWEESVSTGKQRVHVGYRTVLESEIRNFRSGHHSTRIAALRALDQQMQEQGYRLHVWGLDPRYYETGLSDGSGYGYIAMGHAERDRLVRLISPADPASSSPGRSNGQPLPVPRESAWVSVVLLGDSIFDNQNYVEQDQAVIHHLDKWLGPAGSAQLLAVDGSVARDVHRQLVRLPADATHVFLSAGGNDALGCLSVLDQRVATVMEALALLTERQNYFAQNYLALADQLAQLRLPVTVCTVYEDVPDLIAPVRTALSLFNDVIVRAALRHQFGILDLREHLQSATDYSLASPIEPSETGGDKIARAVARAAGVAV